MRVCTKVAMGQGQAEVAMQLLQECATNGEWLCLKNLHLVTAWLPALEKVAHHHLLSTIQLAEHSFIAVSIVAVSFVTMK